ncbi:MAG: hypothetical protein D6788_00990 [Planctomycetota bacterium]|nr:MAG: hypothetical protein D6788_00990 [Planctomycetota bacterium]
MLPNNIAVDDQGNSYVSGGFVGSVAFGTVPLVSAGQQDAYLVKYDPDGNLLWARAGGGSLFDAANPIAISPDGSIWLGGMFEGTAMFGSTMLTASGGGRDVFLVQYDAAGNVISARSFAGDTDEEMSALAIDSTTGDIYAAGSFGGILTLGSTVLTTAGSLDVFLTKLDANGNVLWARRAGGSDLDAATGLGIDAAGNVFVGGFFRGTSTFDNVTLTSGVFDDIFLARYDPNGNVVWAQSFGVDGFDTLFDLATDAAGNVYITGSFCCDPLTIGPFTLPPMGVDTMLTAKFAPDGSALWARSDSPGGGLGSAGGPAGTTYVTSLFTGTATFDTLTLSSAGGSDVFVVQYGSSGEVLHAFSYGGSDADRGVEIAVDGGGNVYVTGQYTAPATFGNVTLTDGNAFLAKIGVINVPAISGRGLVMASLLLLLGVTCLLRTRWWRSAAGAAPNG